MNLVALLVAPAVVTLSIGPDSNQWLRYGIAAVATVVIVAAVVVSKNRRVDMAAPTSGPSGVDLRTEEGVERLP